MYRKEHAWGLFINDMQGETTRRRKLWLPDIRIQITHSLIPANQGIHFQHWNVLATTSHSLSIKKWLQNKDQKNTSKINRRISFLRYNTWR